MTRLVLARPRRRRITRRLAGGRLTKGQENALGVAAIAVVLLVGGRIAEHTAPAAPAIPAGPAAAAAPFRGSGGGKCSLPDPTAGSGGAGCVTPVTAHGLSELQRVFGPVHDGPAIGSADCWDRHAWNPSSDHPTGRACDLFPGRAGVFAAGAQLDHGWAVARWLRGNAAALHVRYVIWQGRIWQADHNRDQRGWGEPYNGGGVYDPADATGGHFDHVHVSFQAA